MSKDSIFISYRRADSAGYAQALFEHLCQRFGSNRVFIDVDKIDIGVDFADRLENALETCAVLIALIGKGWFGESERSESRINNAEDFVFLEVSTALRRQITVIPVLVDDAKMPTADKLPRGLKPLARRQVLELSNSRFRSMYRA